MQPLQESARAPPVSSPSDVADFPPSSAASAANAAVEAAQLLPSLDEARVGLLQVWMLELEAMMLRSIRDVVKASIDDYIVTPRPEWMQKWPGMHVLNASQLHWTKETEDDFKQHGDKAPFWS